MTILIYLLAAIGLVAVCMVVLEHLAQGMDNIEALGKAMGFRSTSIRRYLYKLRDEGLVKSTRGGRLPNGG